MRTYGPSWRTLPRAIYIPNRDRQSPTQYSPDTTDTYLSHRGHWPLERTWRPVRVGAARTGGAEVCLDPPGDCPPLLLDHVDSPGRLTDDTSCILGIFQLKSLFYNNISISKSVSGLVCKRLGPEDLRLSSVRFDEPYSVSKLKDLLYGLQSSVLRHPPTM